MVKNFQDIILNSVRRDNIPVTIFLTNGFQIRGIIKGFDNYVILMESDGKQQMVYKHAVSTIIPLKHVNDFNPSSDIPSESASQTAE